jgi:threonine dehydratase
MARPTHAQLDAAAEVVHKYVTPTAQICWPLLCERTRCEVWVKHENHTPIGSFKVRGGLVYMEHLKRTGKAEAGVIAATRGNHGQSVAFAARACGVPSTVVVPHGNSVEKNRAMVALGAELIEHGHDFNASLDYAEGLADERGLHMFPSFDDLLVHGVASYTTELLTKAPGIHTLYVPLGMGSGICGAIAARDLLRKATRIVGVISDEAPTYALSFDAKQPIPTNTADTLADGLAVRIPNKDALMTILEGAERIVSVSEEQILAAMGHYFSDTHNIAEGAGAAALAALLKDGEAMHDKRVGLVLSGGNLDRALYMRALGAQLTDMEGMNHGLTG